MWGRVGADTPFKWHLLFPSWDWTDPNGNGGRFGRIRTLGLWFFRRTCDENRYTESAPAIVPPRMAWCLATSSWHKLCLLEGPGHHWCPSHCSPGRSKEGAGQDSGRAHGSWDPSLNELLLLPYMVFCKITKRHDDLVINEITWLIFKVLYFTFSMMCLHLGPSLVSSYRLLLFFLGKKPTKNSQVEKTLNIFS